MSLLENKLKEKLTFVILCAGEGKRLKKLTKDNPKPLLKINGLENGSILQNTIFKLIKLGIKQIAIIIGHLGSAISEFVSSLTKKDLSLQNKLVIINSENQYKFGPLYSFLSITKNKTIYNDNNYFLLIPGDTIFDLSLLKEILSIISKNYETIQKYPFIFYRNIAPERLREIYKKNKVISNAELKKSGFEIVLKMISQLKISNIHPEAIINQILPFFGFDYDIINEILNFKEQNPFTTVWETLNYLISNKKKVIAFNIESKYQFFDIDDKYDLKKLKKKKDNRCPDYSMNN
ncbi:MAG: NTP transferase domain-containing protein [Candidatus Lokiarchaeota archaeon]|nr:NTP transferase domain-containing protein [Candidatus Lokiarchaeota archaeon]